GGLLAVLPEGQDIHFGDPPSAFEEFGGSGSPALHEVPVPHQPLRKEILLAQDLHRVQVRLRGGADIGRAVLKKVSDDPGDGPRVVTRSMWSISTRGLPSADPKAPVALLLSGKEILMAEKRDQPPEHEGARIKKVRHSPLVRWRDPAQVHHGKGLLLGLGL